MSSLALLVGLVVVNVLTPGAGMNVSAASLDASAVAGYAAPGQMKGTADFLLDVIPESAVGAFAEGHILQVLLFALLFGFALHGVGGRASPVFDARREDVGRAVRIVSIVMKAAPIGAFGAMAFTVGTYGIGTLASLAGFMATFYLTCLLFVFGVLGAIARLHGFSDRPLHPHDPGGAADRARHVVVGAVLPRMMDKLERLGASRSVVGLVVPTGYSFNLDGTSIYLTMAAVFLAQATNTPLGIGQQLTLLAVLLLTSKGAAGVTGSGFVVLAATLSAVGTVPVAALALILGVDRFMSEARALTNMVGNGVATLVVARWVGELDRDRLSAGLAHGVSGLPAEAPENA